MKAQLIQQSFVPLPGKAKAEYLSWGLSHYRHPDWLGSSRLESSTTHGIIQSVAYDSFGVPYAQLSGGNGEISYTEQNKDTAWLQYDFLDRQYDPTQGRWLSPDPTGLKAVDLASPQSWNRYAYVQNNPLAMVDPFGDWEACYDSNGNEVGGSGGVDPGICNSLTTGSYSWLSAPDGCGGVQATGNGTGFSCTGADGQTVNLGPSGQQAPSDGSDSSAPSNGVPDKKSCSARLAAGIQENTGVTPTNLQYTGTIGGHANYSFDVSDPTGFQSILSNNPPFPLPFGIDQGYRHGVIQSTHVENTLTGGFSGHTDIFSGHSIFAPLHLLIDVGIGHIPGVNLDFGCKAGS